MVKEMSNECLYIDGRCDTYCPLDEDLLENCINPEDVNKCPYLTKYTMDNDGEDDTGDCLTEDEVNTRFDFDHGEMERL